MRRHGQPHVEPGDARRGRHGAARLPGPRHAALGGSRGRHRHAGRQRHDGALRGRDREHHPGAGHLHLRPALRAGRDPEPADPGRRHRAAHDQDRRRRHRRVEHGLRSGRRGLRSVSLGHGPQPLGQGQPAPDPCAGRRAAGRAVSRPGSRRFEDGTPVVSAEGNRDLRAREDLRSLRHLGRRGRRTAPRERQRRASRPQARPCAARRLGRQQRAQPP